MFLNHLLCTGTNSLLPNQWHLLRPGKWPGTVGRSLDFAFSKLWLLEQFLFTAFEMAFSWELEWALDRGGTGLSAEEVQHHEPTAWLSTSTTCLQLGPSSAAALSPSAEEE